LSDILAESNTWLEGQRHSYLTQSVTFKRGVGSVSILATIGETEYQVEDVNGNLLTSQSIDFIIRPEDIAIYNVPQKGDTIERIVGSKVLTYEVWTPTGVELFEFDTSRESIRIHTQLINEADL